MSFKQITQIGRKTVNIQDNENLCMHVYDIPVENLSFEKRWSVLTQDYDKYFHKASRIIRSQCSYFKQFPEKYTSCKNPQFLNIYRNNYEGTMLRNASGLYAFGKRSSDLLKIKQFQDAEAKIIGVTQLFTYEKVIVPMGTPGARKKSNGTYVKNGEPTPQNMIGALVCELNNGVKFEIGTGFTHEERSAYWCVPPIGHYVTFQYQELSGDGVPLFPSFLRMKEDL
jgi:DNA ligase-1